MPNIKYENKIFRVTNIGYLDTWILTRGLKVKKLYLHFHKNFHLTILDTNDYFNIINK